MTRSLTFTYIRPLSHTHSPTLTHWSLPRHISKLVRTKLTYLPSPRSHLRTLKYLLGLTGPIAWQPSGELIAAPRLLPNRLEISLFERNGLQHYFVPLRVDRSAVVQQLSWNADSDLLALLVHLPERGLYLLRVRVNCSLFATSHVGGKYHIHAMPQLIHTHTHTHTHT
jgi:IKI3 family